MSAPDTVPVQLDGREVGRVPWSFRIPLRLELTTTRQGIEGAAELDHGLDPTDVGPAVLCVTLPRRHLHGTGVGFDDPESDRRVVIVEGGALAALADDLEHLAAGLRGAVSGLRRLATPTRTRGAK